MAEIKQLQPADRQRQSSGKQSPELLGPLGVHYSGTNRAELWQQRQRALKMSETTPSQEIERDVMSFSAAISAYEKCCCISK